MLMRTRRCGNQSSFVLLRVISVLVSLRRGNVSHPGTSIRVSIHDKMKKSPLFGVVDLNLADDDDRYQHASNILRVQLASRTSSQHSHGVVLELLRCRRSFSTSSLFTGHACGANRLLLKLYCQ